MIVKKIQKNYVICVIINISERGVVIMNKEDTLKKVQKIDEKGIDKNSPVVPYLNKYFEW